MRTSAFSLLAFMTLPACFRIADQGSLPNSEVETPRVPPVVARRADHCPNNFTPLERLENVESYNAHVGPCGDLVYFDGTNNRARLIGGGSVELAGAFEDFDATGDLVALRTDHPQFLGSDNQLRAVALMNLRTKARRMPSAAGPEERGGFGYDPATGKSYGLVYTAGKRAAAIERWAPGNTYAPVDVAAPSELLAYARAGTVVLGMAHETQHRIVMTDTAANTSTLLPVELSGFDRAEAVWLSETGEVFVVQRYAEANGHGWVQVGTELYRTKDGALLANLGDKALFEPFQGHDPKEVLEAGGVVVFQSVPKRSGERAVLRLAVDLNTGRMLQPETSEIVSAKGTFLGLIADGRLAFGADAAETRAPDSLGGKGGAWLVEVASGKEVQIASFGMGTRAVEVSPDASAVIYETATGALGTSQTVWRGKSRVPSFAEAPYAQGSFAQNGAAFTVVDEGVPTPRTVRVEASPGDGSQSTALTFAGREVATVVYGNTAAFFPVVSIVPADFSGTPPPITRPLWTVDATSLPKGGAPAAERKLNQAASKIVVLTPAHGHARLFTLSSKDPSGTPQLHHGMLNEVPHHPPYGH